LKGFLTRRLTPAIRTCAATEERQENLSRKLARAAQLLRTRVEIELESQNKDLLSKMNDRFRLQLKLQQAVKIVSIGAILIIFWPSCISYSKGCTEYLTCSIPSSRRRCRFLSSSCRFFGYSGAAAIIRQSLDACPEELSKESRNRNNLRGMLGIAAWFEPHRCKTMALT